MDGAGDQATSVSRRDVTRLVLAWAAGDEAALLQLMPLVYDDLHRLARRYMAREQPGQTLQTTALVHEVYLRLVDVKNVNWQDRAHFYALCARLMRRILIDFARSRTYQKRGGGAAHVDLDEAATVSAVVGDELLAVDHALEQLFFFNSRQPPISTLFPYTTLFR